MTERPLLDIERLKIDMADCVAKTSARKFSLDATQGRNPDFYRNFVNNGQDKRMSAEVFAGIVLAVGRSADDYIRDATTSVDGYKANATVLTSTFAMLLDSLGIDPYEDGRAQKLAAQFPNALRRIEDLHALTASGSDETAQLK